MHQEIASLGGADQASDGGLPFFKTLVSFRQAYDVVAGISKR